MLRSTHACRWSALTNFLRAPEPQPARLSAPLQAGQSMPKSGSSLTDFHAGVVVSHTRVVPLSPPMIRGQPAFLRLETPTALHPIMRASSNAHSSTIAMCMTTTSAVATRIDFTMAVARNQPSQSPEFVLHASHQFVPLVRVRIGVPDDP